MSRKAALQSGAMMPEVDVAKLLQNTILDGEIVALDDHGRSSFNLLQHHQNRAAAILYYAFDLLVYEGKRLLGVPLPRAGCSARTECGCA